MNKWCIIDKGLKQVQFIECSDDLNCVAGVLDMLEKSYNMPNRMSTSTRFGVELVTENKIPYKKYSKYVVVEVEING